MDVLLPPPGATRESNHRLAKVLENLGSKVDRFNKNIEDYNKNVIKLPLPPTPNKLYIPKYIVVLLLVLGIYMFFNRRSVSNTP